MPPFNGEISFSPADRKRTFEQTSRQRDQVPEARALRSPSRSASLGRKLAEAAAQPAYLSPWLSPFPTHIRSGFPVEYRRHMVVVQQREQPMTAKLDRDLG